MEYPFITLEDGIQIDSKVGSVGNECIQPAEKLAHLPECGANALDFTLYHGNAFNPDIRVIQTQTS